MAIIKINSKYPECRFIKSDGRRCHSPAMRGMAYCYFHQPSRRRPTNKGRPQKPFVFELPGNGEGFTYRKSMDSVTKAVAEGRLNRSVAGLCSYAINLAAQLVGGNLKSASAPQAPRKKGGEGRPKTSGRDAA